MLQSNTTGSWKDGSGKDYGGVIKPIIAAHLKVIQGKGIDNIQDADRVLELGHWAGGESPSAIDYARKQHGTDAGSSIIFITNYAIKGKYGESINKRTVTMVHDINVMSPTSKSGMSGATIYYLNSYGKVTSQDNLKSTEKFQDYKIKSN